MEINHYIDSTLLDPTATLKDIEVLCNQAIEYHFASVCVMPYYVSLAKELLKDTNIAITTVVGFPLGMNTTSVKSYEAIESINNGADEIDMVINLGMVKNKDYQAIKEEIEEMRDAIDGKVLKVIFEVGYLTKEEIIQLTEICNQTFIHFIKTSTGFREKLGTIEDVKLIKKYKNEVVEIKAAGGIKTISDALTYIEAGATRIGTSHAVDIMRGEENEII